MCMDLYERLKERKEKLAVVGLGYVGMPLAVAFARSLDVIGFDVNSAKVALYNRGIDPTREVGDEAIRGPSVAFTDDEAMLGEARFLVVAVPTPVREDKTPDLAPLEGAARTVGRNLARGSVVVFESTVYPGATEEVCVPILERESGLRCGRDFRVGYSPERINPSDREHTLASVVKVVSGMDGETLETVARVYGLVALAGVHRAASIRVAEAAKVIENSQRDINIAFMNELSIIFHRMGIDTREVLEAAGTKWNFLGFRPGLVGGHCIGVDPYYLTHKAAQLGYHSQVILSGRRINDDMGRYVAESVVKGLIRAGRPIRGARVAVLGFAFKENCQDTRNTRVIDILRELWEYGVATEVADPVADPGEARELYGVDLVPVDGLARADAAVVCVQHDAFRHMSRQRFDSLLEGAPRLLFDIKGIYDRDEFTGAGYHYWRL